MLERALADAEIYKPYKEKVIPEAEYPVAPPSDSECWTGLAGEFVREISDYAEPSPISLLVQFITKFGVCINKPYAQVAATKHKANLFTAIVGQTGAARKGDSLNFVEMAFMEAAPSYLPERVSGISSGEGIIHKVRDSQVNELGDIVNQGVEDKRLFIYEPELSRLLHVMTRQGDTTSDVMRHAFDGDFLQTANKNSPDKATNPHISVIGHITPDELKSDLRKVQMANGLGNRFLWIATHRAQYIANPRIFSPSDSLKRHISDALAQASTIGLVVRSAAANEFWERIYPELSSARPGLIGAMQARSEAQCLRLQTLYALMRGSSVIEVSDIKAALAIVVYSAQTVNWLFEGVDVDAREEEILQALRGTSSKSMARTDIRALFGGHLTASDLDGLRDKLTAKELIKMETVETPGRPTEMWRLT